MFFQRYYLDCLSHASYMVADETTKSAAVIDPQRDIDIYVAEAEQRGLRIEHVILTHFHADFIAGHIELRDKLGATIYLGSKAEAEFEFEALKDGSAIGLGLVRLEALETPGHTPEGISILVFDETVNAETPVSVLTGDTLFIGDVGRPDLLASVGYTANELAEMLYSSLHDKLLALPDRTLVYPAHGAGSMCGKNMSDAAVSTIGEQKRLNYALQPMSREKFIQIVTAEQPEAPAYFVHDALLNKRDRATLDSSLSQSLNALTIEDVLAFAADGAQIVDIRAPNEFAGAHLKGSINVGIDGRFATWVGTVIDHDRPVIITGDSDRIEEAVMRFGRIGFDNVIGYLDRGMKALDGRSDLIEQSRRIAVGSIEEFETELTIVDVRSPREWDSGHMEASINIPLDQLRSRLDDVPADVDVIVHCQGGYRSSIAVSILLKAGRANVIDLIGGYAAWIGHVGRDGVTCQEASDSNVRP